MTNLVEEFKSSFKKQDNGLVQLILINVVIFVVMGIIFVFSTLFRNDTLYNFLLTHIYLPADFSEFLKKPWTIFTYFFGHSGPFHILFNMLGLYWFGRLIHEYIGNRRLINIYILGGLIGGVVYLLLYNLVPYFADQKTALMIGASGSVYAVSVAAATLLPHYSFHLVFIGSVRIVYIVAFFIFISFLGSVGANAGGNICHLGGALLGYVYIKQLQKGRDLGQPINFIAKFLKSFRKSNLKVTYRKESPSEVSQNDIDAILDKISRSGYNSLSKQEKEKLYNASQK